MLKSIIDLLFPKYCLLCGKQGSSICDYCKRKLIPSLPECYKCRRLSPVYKTHTKCKDLSSLDSVFWGWQYDKDSSNLIKSFKYKGAFTLSKEISEILCRRILETNFLGQFTNPLLIPIPIHKTKERERGFNQSLLLSSSISEILNIPLREDLLFRTVNGSAQAQKGKFERRFLPSNTFIFDFKHSQNQEIILIDDVITTGSTLDTAAKAIKSGNKDIKISAICILRGKPFYSSEVVKSDIS